MKLSPRSAKAAAAELVRKAKAKKEKEEREMEKLREQERIRSGKELLEAKRKEADQARPTVPRPHLTSAAQRHARTVCARVSVGRDHRNKANRP